MFICGGPNPEYVLMEDSTVALMEDGDFIDME